MILAAFTVYGAAIAFLAACFWFAYRRPPVDEGIAEDSQVAELDAIWALPVYEGAS